MTSICKHHVHGNCKYGGACTFDHSTVDAARAQKCCVFALLNECKASPCKYTHRSVGEIRAAAGADPAGTGHVKAPSHGAGFGTPGKGGPGGAIVPVHSSSSGKGGSPIIPFGSLPSLHHGAHHGHGGAGATTTVYTKVVEHVVVSSSPSARPVPEAVKGPKKPFVCEVALSMDTTGSMYRFQEQVTASVKEVCGEVHRRLLSKSKEADGGAGAAGPRKTVRYALIAHGDYCDAKSSYVIKSKDFTTNAEELKSFADGCGPTGGGDADECYELALHTAATRLSWSPASAVKILVVFGDANPHSPTYGLNKHHYDWRKEAQTLKEKGVIVIAVHCGGSSSSKPFYDELARITGGSVLSLDYGNTPDVTQLITGLCIKAASEKKFKRYEEDLRASGKRSDRVFSQLASIHISRSEYHYSATGSGAGGVASLTKAMATASMGGAGSHFAGHLLADGPAVKAHKRY